jgi:molybdopterin synthase catalytic subunit
VNAVRIQTGDFDLSTEIAALRAGDARVGAVVGFVGTVRDMNDGANVAEMELEHYPGMTEQALIALAEAATERWSLLGVTMVHRVGVMVPGDRIVFVGTAAHHRREALEACAYLIDRLKTDAPFWKRERLGDDSRWVEARAGDTAAAGRWEK